MPGLVPVRGDDRVFVGIAEQAAMRQAAAIGDIDYIFFRRFSDERSSQVTAYIIDNSDARFSEHKLAEIHKKVWLNGSTPLLYVGWQTRVDILSCARGPDFWRNDGYHYQPAEQITIASQISHALEEKVRRFSAFRLSDGTFWDDPANFKLAQADKAAHRRLINAVVEADRDLDGEKNPLLRRLLLLTVLIKYLEDRGVFPDGWFDQCHKSATSFFDVLQNGTADEVRELLNKLERKFNGDVFALPEDTKQRLTTKELHRFAELVESKTIKAQRYLWGQFSFQHIPVEVLSHLYQRFAQHGTGAVFTPPFVASLMLDYALPYDRLTENERILDPTCGSGIFLVGAFRRLVHLWQSRNKWAQPDVPTLKAVLKQSIFGVELQEEAVDLTAFSLALAVCDALQPNVIWKDLRFDKLVGSTLLAGDFFEKRDKLRSLCGEKGFTAILGNPPFQSRFSDAAKQVNERVDKSRVVVPDKQMAYLIAEQAMPLLQSGGRLCLIQPAGFLYNENARAFQKAFIAANQTDAVLDFTSIRKLYDGADPKTVALVVTKRKPTGGHKIRHCTFRRTFSVRERVGFELDHYDRHVVSQKVAENHAWVWRVNLLGGGRLQHLTERMAEMPKLRAFVEERGWDYGEGFITATRGKREPASWLTGKPFLPTLAFTLKGIDESKISIVTETKFRSAYTETRYSAPIVMIREHDSLPCVFRKRGFLAYKAKIVGIHADPAEENVLRRFYEDFLENRSALRAFCVLLGTQALVGKATAILKRDIDVLPWPKGNTRWDLSRWEKILCEDVINLTAEFVRLGQNSKLLRRRVTNSNLKEYADTFVEMLGTVYGNLRPVKSLLLDGIACQAFCFGKTPELDWSNDWTAPLHKLIYVQHGEALRTVRVLRFYDRNVILVVKPDRLRYWIRSTAIHDADETLYELQKQGY
jgi:type I restriction-modification system DNA methylase subunit